MLERHEKPVYFKKNMQEITWKHIEELCARSRVELSRTGWSCELDDKTLVLCGKCWKSEARRGQGCVDGNELCMEMPRIARGLGEGHGGKACKTCAFRDASTKKAKPFQRTIAHTVGGEAHVGKT